VGKAGQVWDTAGVADTEQFAYWHDVVWDAFVPVTISRPSEGPFPGSIAARPLGPIGLSRICSQPQRVSRTEADIERGAGGGVYFLNLPLSDRTRAAQHGRDAHLRRGDFVLIDSEQPFRLEFANPFQQISLAIPHELLSPMLASPQEVTALRIRGDRGVGAVAVATIRDLAKGPTPDLGRQDSRALADHLVSLISLSLRGLRRSQASISAGLLLQAAFDEIDACLHDPHLTPSVVAMRLSVSVRYLHKIFAEHGTSFGRCLLRRRLETIRRCLEEPCWDGLTITEVATRHGFYDPSYLARVFKKHFHVAPSEYRLAASNARQPLQLLHAVPSNRLRVR
jgi:AraC family transcriptional regulator, positive regulator of tynA and feaB